MKTLSLLFFLVFTSVCVADEPNTGRYSGTIKVTTSITILAEHPPVTSVKAFKFEKATLMANGPDLSEGYGLYILTDMGEQPMPDSLDLLTCIYINDPDVPAVESETTARRIKFKFTQDKIIGGFTGTVTYEGVFTWKAKP